MGQVQKFSAVGYSKLYQDVGPRLVTDVLVNATVHFGFFQITRPNPPLLKTVVAVK